MTDRRRIALSRVASVLAAFVALVAGPAAAIAVSGHGGGGSSGITRKSSTPGGTTTTPRTSTSTPTTTSTTTTPATASGKGARKKPPAKKKKPKPKPKPPLQARLPAAPTVLTGSLGVSGFPSRALVLLDPSTSPLSAAALHVTENGRPVGHFVITPLSSPLPRDFGVVLVISQSMELSATSLLQEMGAVNAIATHRSGSQALGIVTFAQDPGVLLPVTANGRTIGRIVNTTPWVAPGSRVGPAIALALAQLQAAHITAGAVVVISDDGNAGVSPAELAKIADTATAAGVQIFAVGLQDGVYKPAPMHALAAALHAPLAEGTLANPEPLASALWSRLTQGYLIRYHSSAPSAHAVSVAASIDGVPGTVTASYVSPRAPKAPPQPKPVTTPTQPPALHSVVIPALASPVAQVRRHSFWNSSTSVLAVAGLVALLLCVAVVVLLAPRREALKTRVGSFIPTGAAPDDSAGSIASTAEDPTPPLLARRRWWPRFVSDVEAARLKRKPVALVKRTAIIGVVAAVLVTVMLGSPFLGILAMVPSQFLLRYVVRRLARRQRAKFEDQLPSHLQDLAGAMRAGRSIVGALASVADGAEEPMRSELERALADERLGLSLEETLEAIAKRMQSDGMDQFALVAALHRRSGSNVAEALDRVAEGARDRADMRREMRALTAQARMSGWVLSGLPPVFLAAMYFVDPQYAAPMFNTAPGLIALVFSCCLVLAGRFVMNRIVNVDA